MHRRRRGLWIALVGVAVVVVVVLLVVVGTGRLNLGPSKTGTITVTGVEWVLVQGTTETGIGWFGPSPVYQNSTGGYPYPVSVAAGGTFSARLSIYDHDSVNHSVSRLGLPSGWSLLSVTPSFGTSIGRSDQSALVVQLGTPGGSSDQSVYLVVQVYAQ